MKEIEYTYTYEVTHRESTEPIDIDTKEVSRVFGTWSDPSKAKNQVSAKQIDWATNIQEKPVHGHYSIRELAEYINSNNKHKKKGGKYNSDSLLKGLYKDGTSGKYLVKTSNWLPFDIDVKQVANGDNDDENLHLLDRRTNTSLRNDILPLIAPISFRSSGDLGTGGFIFVEGMDVFTNEQTLRHKNASDAVYSYIQNSGLSGGAKFDTAQGKFRQVRNFGNQRKAIVEARTNTIIFSVVEHREAKTYANGEVKYKLDPSTFKDAVGSPREQFNTQTTWESLLLQANYTQVNDNRWKGSRTTSTSSAVIDDSGELLWNHSSSESSISTFNKFTFFCHYMHNDNKQEANAEIERLFPSKLRGVVNAPTLTDIEEIRRTIRSEMWDKRDATFTNKLKLIEAYKRAESEDILRHHLGLTNLEIASNMTLNVAQWLSSVGERILFESFKHNRVLIYAPTGLGKNFFVSNRIHELEPNARILVIAPLTAIVEQQGAMNEGSVMLTGKSTDEDYARAKNAKMVFATQEQGAKELAHSKSGVLTAMPFDYIIIDEIHALINGLGYKRKTINALLDTITEEDNVIALSGTPTPLSTSIGYHVIKIVSDSSEPLEINHVIDTNTDTERLASVITNSEALKTAEQKIVIRLNNVKVAQSVKKALEDRGLFNKGEISVLNSSNKTLEYYELVNTKKLLPRTRVLITTSLIDEGVNLEDALVTEMYFISNLMGENPAQVRQFFGRNRDSNEGRSFTLMLKGDKEQLSKQIHSQYNLEESFNKSIKQLEKDISILSDDNAYSVLNTDKFYTTDGKVNKYQVAKEISREYFKSLCLDEYLYYMKINYNVNSELIASRESTEEIDEVVSESKSVGKGDRSELLNIFLDNQLFFYKCARDTTKNRTIKKRIAELDTHGLIEHTQHASQETIVLFRRQVKFVDDKMKSILRLKEANLDVNLITKTSPVKNQIAWRDNQKLKNVFDLHYLNELTIKSKPTQIDKKNIDRLNRFVKASKKEMERSGDDFKIDHCLDYWKNLVESRGNVRKIHKEVLYDYLMAS